jgi:hypothetical protein
MSKANTRFEQVPLKVIEKIIKNAEEQEQPIKNIRRAHLVLEPSSKKSEPYSLSAVSERKTASR